MDEATRVLIRSTIAAAARKALCDGSCWQVNALYMLLEQGFATRDAQAYVAAAEAHFK